jgi:soluble lytic murein transglycosylase-like protein
MQPIAFCNRCRGMKVGWNKKYILHCLACQEWLSKSYKLLILTAVLSSFVFAFPVSTGLVLSDFSGPKVAPGVAEASLAPVPKPDASAAVQKMLANYGVEKERLVRVTQAIMASSAKYRIDPKLVASIIIVESRANPFAVSDADSVGIMQVHLHTWGEIADKENINLFKIEDNIDFGVRILRDYIVGSNTWEGVAKYKGRFDTPESQQSADDYVRKVQGIYGLTPSASAAKASF